MSQRTPDSTPTPHAIRTSISVGLLAVAAMGMWIMLGRVRDIMTDGGLPPLIERSAIAILTFVLGTALAIWIARYRHGWRLTDLGLRRSKAVRDVALGAGFWLGLAAAGLIVGTSLEWIELDVELPTLSIMGVILLQAFLVLTLEAVPEEIIFRGVVLSLLEQHMPWWAASLLQAVVFTLLGWVSGPSAVSSVGA